MNWYLVSCRPNRRDLFLKQLDFEIEKNQLGNLFLEQISPRDAIYKDMVLLHISDLPSARTHLKAVTSHQLRQFSVINNQSKINNFSIIAKSENF